MYTYSDLVSSAFARGFTCVLWNPNERNSDLFVLCHTVCLLLFWDCSFCFALSLPLLLLLLLFVCLFVFCGFLVVFGGGGYCLFVFCLFCFCLFVFACLFLFDVECLIYLLLLLCCKSVQ